MNYLVTGAAGFIGSHLCKKLILDGAHILAVDGFTDFYPRWLKEKNIQTLVNQPHFELIPHDLLDMDLNNIMEKIDVVFHLAAQPGVRTSWGSDFSIYTKNNIDVTQRLLEAAIIFDQKIHLCFILFRLWFEPSTSHVRNKHVAPILALWRDQISC